MTQAVNHLVTQASNISPVEQAGRLRKGYAWLAGCVHSVAMAPVHAVQGTAHAAKALAVGTYHLAEKAVVGTYHAVESTVHAGATLAYKTAEATKNVAAATFDLLGADIEVLGMNVNPLVNVKRLGATSTDQELNEQLDKLDQKVTPLIVQRDEEEEIATPNASPTKVQFTDLAALVKEEKSAKERIAKKFLDFSIISTFESIYSTADCDLFSFHARFANEPDPIAAYVNHLYTKNKGIYLLARILMPLMKLFTKALLGSMPEVLNNFGKFLNDKEAVKGFTITFLKATALYLKSTEPGSLNREDHRAAYDQLNETLFNALKVKTHHKISDAFLNKILGFVLNKIDPLKLTMDSLFAQNGEMNPNTAVSLLDLVDTALIGAKTTLTTQVTAEAPAPGTLMNEKPLSDKVFSSEEKDTVRVCIASLMGHLTANENLTAIVDPLIRKSLASTATEAVLNVLAGLIEGFGDSENSLKTRNQIFEFIDSSLGQDYSQAPILSKADVTQKQQVVEKHLNEVIDIGMDLQFANEMGDQGVLDKLQKMTFAMNNIRENLQGHEKLIKLLYKTFDNKAVTCKVDLHQEMLTELQESIRDLKKYMNDALEVAKGDNVTTHRIRRQVGAINNQLEKIVAEVTRIQDPQTEKLDVKVLDEAFVKIENFAKGLTPQKKVRLPQWARMQLAKGEKALVKRHVRHYVGPLTRFVVNPTHLENLFVKGIAPNLSQIIG